MIVGGLFMRIKTVLKSLFLAYALTGAFLLLLALLVFRLDLGTAPVAAGIVAIYVISCLAGGFLAGKLMRKDKYFWGILVGLSYFLLLGAAAGILLLKRLSQEYFNLLVLIFSVLAGIKLLFF